jgi:threonine dehydratase
MSEIWNISLFHYRMQGGDYGNVLIGLEIPPHEDSKYHRFLNKLGYRYLEETDNAAYHVFM